jgi:outer membrane protein insertion porin family
MRLRLAAAPLFLAFLLGWPASSPAQSTSPAPTIAAIEFQGLRTLAEETLRYYLGIEVGTVLDEARLNRNVQQLWQRRLLDDIRIGAETVAGGVRLTVTVVERPVLRSISYEGFKRVATTDINDRILKDHLAVREGEPLDLGELHRLQAVLGEMYKEKGYRFAEVKSSVEESGPGERRVILTVDEGDRVRIADIAFDGNEIFGDRRLRLAMRKTKETGLMSRILKKDIYNPATLEEDLKKVGDTYRRAGYKNAKVGDPAIEVKARHPGAATSKQQKRRLYLTIPLAEGQRYRFGDITVEGNERYSDEILLRLFHRRQGAWLRSKSIEEGLEKISDSYRNNGFIYAQVTPELIEREGNIADLVVRIVEGDQYKVGRIEFKGNTRTRDKVLRRELRVQEGLFLNMGALKNSVYKIGQLGYFKLDENDPIQFENFDTEKKTVDLVLKGEESDRTELQVGGGWSEVDGFFGQFSVKTQNFLGRGETVGLNYQAGRIRDLFDLSYYVPFFLDRPQSIGVQAYRSKQDYSLLAGSDYVQDSTGGVLTYGRSLGYFGQASINYSNSSYKDRRSFDITGVPPVLTNDDNCQVTVNEALTQLTQACDRTSSSLRPIYSYDSRDSRLEPTRGMRISASVDYAGGFLGGNTYYYRPEVGFSIYKPVSQFPLRTVFGFNAEAGLIRAFGGKRLFYFDRYLLGGEQSLRGFRYRQVWVRDKDGKTLFDEFGSPQGGEQFFQMNIEYHLLLGGPFRVVMFGDAGNVWGAECFKSTDLGCRQGKFDISRLRYSAGAEVRIFVPVFGAPLRFIYASNLDPQPDDRFESFQFSIGTTF